MPIQRLARACLRVEDDAGAPNAVWARPLSLPSDPVATGRPRPGQQRPRAQCVRVKVNAGPPQPAVAIGRGEADPVPESVAAAASNRKSINLNRLVNAH